MKVDIKNYRNGGYSRKISVKIDDFDTWSLDHTLAIIIYPALLQLKNTKHGVPGEFADVGGESHGTQDSFDFYKESHNEAFDEGSKRWDEILDKMIWSFEQLLKDDYSEQYHHGEAKFEFVIENEDDDYSVMKDLNPTEHWYDGNGHMLHEQRIQEGLDLFGRYFRSLWD